MRKIADDSKRFGFVAAGTTINDFKEASHAQGTTPSKILRDTAHEYIDNFKKNGVAGIPNVNTTPFTSELHRVETIFDPVLKEDYTRYVVDISNHLVVGDRQLYCVYTTGVSKRHGIDECPAQLLELSNMGTHQVVQILSSVTPLGLEEMDEEAFAKLLADTELQGVITKANVLRVIDELQINLAKARLYFAQNFNDKIQK